MLCSVAVVLDGDAWQVHCHESISSDALSGCDIFQHPSRNELVSMLMANQGCRGGYTLARSLMAFSIKPEPPRYKIAVLIGTSMCTGRGADRQLMGPRCRFT